MTTPALKICKRFTREATAAGFTVQHWHYRGRNFYDGPAVEVDRDELQKVIRATSMRLIWDEIGKHDLMVYPAL